MTPENKKKYDEKLKRINDAVSLMEPDRVPLNMHAGLYPIFHSGYTVADVVYDTSLNKIKEATIKYLFDFDPDVGTDIAQNLAGEGPVMEIVKPKNIRWAGMPGDIIDKNSFQQFIEFPILLDDEFDEFFSDRTGWELKKALPRISEIYEPFADFQYSLINGVSVRGVRQIAKLFSTTKYREMIEDFWAIEDFFEAHDKKTVAANKEIEELGYPIIQTRGGGGVPYDYYSNFLRGTMLSLADLCERPDDIERFIYGDIEATLEIIKATKGKDEGKHVKIPLHKGMDSFMSDEHYRKYYWNHLQKIILAVIESGKIPYVFTEGKYNTRLDCLTEVPPGKVFYHFEDVDMSVAKQKLGGIACIGGGFPVALLDWSTPEKIRDEVKRLLDICAPGGGFIFEATAGLGNCKRENVEAMFDTVKRFGVY